MHAGSSSAEVGESSGGSISTGPAGPQGVAKGIGAGCEGMRNRRRRDREKRIRTNRARTRVYDRGARDGYEGVGGEGAGRENRAPVAAEAGGGGEGGCRNGSLNFSNN